MTHVNESLLARVAELERKLALLESRAPASAGKRFALQASAVVGLLVVLGNLPLWAQKDDRPPSPQEFVCKGLTVMDKDGKPRLVIGQNVAGAFLKIVNAAGKSEVMLSPSDNGGMIAVFDGAEKPVGILAASKDGGALALQNNRQKTVVYAGTNAHGGLVRASAHDGKDRVWLGVDSKVGDGLILLYDPDGKQRTPGSASAAAQGVLSASPELTDQDAKDKVRTDCFCKIYAVEMRAGVAYQIDMMSKDFDPYIRLEDSSGRELATDDDGGEGNSARLVFTPTESGTYRVVATSFSRGTGRFSLSVRPK